MTASRTAARAMSAAAGHSRLLAPTRLLLTQAGQRVHPAGPGRSPRLLVTWAGQRADPAGQGRGPWLLLTQAGQRAHPAGQGRGPRLLATWPGQRADGCRPGSPASGRCGAVWESVRSVRSTPDVPAARSSYAFQPGCTAETDRHVVDVSANSSREQVDLTWSTGEVTPFPYVWLRDSCLCSECRHPTTSARTVSFAALDLDVRPESLQKDEVRDELVVNWTDGHRSTFPFGWLADRTFDTNSQRRRLEDERGPPMVLWDKATIEPNLFRVDYEALISDKYVLRETLEKLIVYGLLVITNCPTSFGIVPRVAEMLGVVKGTHYGFNFCVTTKVDSNNLAYTSGTLEPHLDLPYYYYVPGVQFLHCVCQHRGTGGDNTLIDSFHVVNQIRQQRPDIFNTLATWRIDYDDYGIETEGLDNQIFHKVTRHKTIKLDEHGDFRSACDTDRLDERGEVQQVCYSNASRSSRFNVPLDQVKPIYTALKHFQMACAEPANQFVYKMENGDMLVMNNLRVMHGRHGFTMTSGDVRQLEGCYVEWEEIISRYRALRSLAPSDGAPAQA